MDSTQLRDSLNDIFVMNRGIDTLKKKILNTVENHVPTGNPITECNVYFLCDAFRKISSAFSPEECKKIKEWAVAIASALLKSYDEGFRIENNFQSHRIHIVSCIGYTFNQRVFVLWAYRAWSKQIETNLRPNGSSLDFEERDSLTYHVFNLQALVFTIKYLSPYFPRFNFYNYASPKNTSLKKSVDFLKPYIKGERQNIMFVNTKYASDKQIQVNLLGKPWDRFNARNLILKCKEYDPSLEEFVTNYLTLASK